METDRSIWEGGTATPTSNEAGESKGPLSMTLLADPDLLDCPICFEPLWYPVYQCENGHIACSSCCTTILKNKCSNCSLRIGNFRCRAIEKIIASVRVRCRYTSYGCTAMLAYNSNADHERTCCYIPCSCPIIGCDFVDKSKSLYDHFALKHKDSSIQFNCNSKISISMDTTQKHLILREEKEGVLFVLNRCIETVGTYFNVVCVAPPSPSSQRLLYELTASKGDDSIKVKMCMEKMSKWTPQTPANMRILIPTNFISTTPLLTLDLIIQKKLSGGLVFF